MIAKLIVIHFTRIFAAHVIQRNIILIVDLCFVLIVALVKAMSFGLFNKVVAKISVKAVRIKASLKILDLQIIKLLGLCNYFK